MSYLYGFNVNKLLDKQSKSLVKTFKLQLHCTCIRYQRHLQRTKQSQRDPIRPGRVGDHRTLSAPTVVSITQRRPTKAYAKGAQTLFILTGKLSMRFIELKPPMHVNATHSVGLFRLS